GAIISGAFLLWFGASDMFFHMVTLPARHPIRDRESGLVWVWVSAVGELLRVCGVGLGLLFVALALDSLAGPRQPVVTGHKLQDWFASRRWSMLLIAAAFSPLASLPAYMKIGGFLNSLAISDYFLLATALAGIVETCAMGS